MPLHAVKLPIYLTIMWWERTQFSNSIFWRLVFSHSWYRIHLQLDFVSLEMNFEPLVWEHQSPNVSVLNLQFITDGYHMVRDIPVATELCFMFICDEIFRPQNYQLPPPPSLDGETSTKTKKIQFIWFLFSFNKKCENILVLVMHVHIYA